MHVRRGELLLRRLGAAMAAQGMHWQDLLSSHHRYPVSRARQAHGNAREGVTWSGHHAR